MWKDWHTKSWTNITRWLWPITITNVIKDYWLQRKDHLEELLRVKQEAHRRKWRSRWHSQNVPPSSRRVVDCRHLLGKEGSAKNGGKGRQRKRGSPLQVLPGISLPVPSATQHSFVRLAAGLGGSHNHQGWISLQALGALDQTFQGQVKMRPLALGRL